MGAPEDKVVSTTERLAVLREAKARREREAADYAAKLEIDLLEVEEKLAAEHGPRGVRWTTVQTSEGPFGLVMGEAGIYKRLQDHKDDRTLSEEVYAFVLAQVAHPSRDRAVEIFGRRRGLVVQCSDALIALHRGEVDALKGKA